MALNWNEIKERAVKFSKEWKNTTNEEADAKPFLDAFFEVFGIPRKKIGTFEHRVKKLSEADGYIDMLWKGMILVEMKSRGKNLDKAFEQALDYTHGLKFHELPKYILVSDFENFRLYDVEEQTTHTFLLKDLVLNVRYFNQMIGYQKQILKEQDPANVKAAELMGKLHDRLEEIGYVGHPLEVYLVRILFCLFAEDTTIFLKQQFQYYIEQRTSEDGSDLASKIQELFQVLNTPKDMRFKNLDEDLNHFPYINGKLFEEVLPVASFDSKMRLALLECCYMDWSQISPAIFGSMFQSVMNPKERRSLGAHYTSESNILKLIKPLFLDELYEEFEKCSHDPARLTTFHNKLVSLKFLDPACGCGNFLIITYREIRLLELKVILSLQKLNLRVYQMEFIDISMFFRVNVDQFYGIEYEEFPARIAEVALWLMDHQMNMNAGAETGKRMLRIPLKKSAKIVHGDAMELDWSQVISDNNITYIDAKDAEIIVNSRVNEPSPTYGTVKIRVESYKIVDEFSEIKPDSKFDYIIGNPPFIGSNVMTQFQRNQIVKVFNNIQGSGVLDYVAGWYLKAAKYIQNTNSKSGFVSTNSVVQGEQAALIWNQMFNTYGVHIHFAHRTFKWNNEAKGNAAVNCVIVGFANFESKNKSIFEYDDIKGEAEELKVKNINQYLIDAKTTFIMKRTKPLCNVPPILKGNYYAKSEGLIVEESDLEFLLENEPGAKQFIKKLIGADEFINNKKRYCLWMVDFNPNDIKKMPLIADRINRVKKDRLASKDKSMQKLAVKPYLFRETNNPDKCLVIPVVSSEKRDYIPMGFIDKDTISTNGNLIMPEANLYHFGVLMSKMHMAWVNVTCGRLKSDYRYSKDIVYNNFPWPEEITDKQRLKIEQKAQQVLDARNFYPNNSLADLYQTYMPPKLVDAHYALNKAVDAAYSKQAFTTDAKRMEFLFELYEKYTAGLFVKEKKGKK
ncbi:class I SAM-dependent DNA methyltransferase [Flavobacterium branchiophilum]|uniref:site-specific DNA-methyltransferase (adenine-specific) n=1 Tax=Flavobacterium branchiophilum TaxID=55197 RepID=A0A2H3KES7_9FLAO|nr:DNA methyltransferase [Flavobacterium branchiophilum]PDS26855.1 SAM-dependent methyltransferase [Flavobacterium branchiophilum]